MFRLLSSDLHQQQEKKPNDTDRHATAHKTKNHVLHHSTAAEDCWIAVEMYGVSLTL